MPALDVSATFSAHSPLHSWQTLCQGLYTSVPCAVFPLSSRKLNDVCSISYLAQKYSTGIRMKAEGKMATQAAASHIT